MRAAPRQRPAHGALHGSELDHDRSGAGAALGLHEQVALVGFDDIVLADAVSPGLTVVAQDPGGLGRAAAELLFERLDGFDGPSRRVELPTRLIARGSGELAPA